MQTKRPEITCFIATTLTLFGQTSWRQKGLPDDRGDKENFNEIGLV